MCKADLLTEVVGEFPELQGLMGKYYAEAQGEDEAVAHACEDHYKPKGPDDMVPADPVSIAVALADKIDTLVGFWAIDEKPTGSKDPYALRRAALGVIRVVVDNALRLHLLKIAGLNADLLSFFADRLKVQLREQGARHDLVDAVFALEGQDDLLMIVRRVEALGQIPRHRRRQESARRRQARVEHPAHRGEEGRQELFRRARRQAFGRAGRKGAASTPSPPPRRMPPPPSPRKTSPPP